MAQGLGHRAHREMGEHFGVVQGVLVMLEELHHLLEALLADRQLHGAQAPSHQGDFVRMNARAWVPSGITWSVLK